MKRIKASHWLIPALTLVVLLCLRLSDPFAVEIARLKGFDLLQRNAERLKSDKVILIDINEKAVEAEGQWPWPRGKMADLIDRLRKANAGVIVLPILFSEPDRFGEDDRLAESISRTRTVVAQNATLFQSLGGVFRGVSRIGDPTKWLFSWPSAIGPIPLIGNQAEGVGMTNLAPELDGVVRRMPLAVNSGGQIFPSIVLEAMRVASGAPSWAIKTGAAGVIALKVARLPKIVTDPNARVWIRYGQKYERYGSHDVLPNLEGRMVVVGLTAVGLAQISSTPFGEMYVHDIIADTLATIQSTHQIKRPDIALLIEIFVMTALGLFIIILAFKAPFWAVVLGTLSLGISTFFAGKLLWQEASILGDITMPLAVILIVGLHASLNRFGAEYDRRIQIKKQFERYVSPKLVGQLQRHPDSLKLGGETKELTLLFCDIRGFTPISEQYKDDPQGLTTLINRFLGPMSWEIMELNGTIDKYMGDCIMAFWNAPLDIPEQQTSAVRAAIKMQERLDILNAELLSENKLPINVGIGINSGPCVVGNMGSAQRFDYSCLGDAVNLASRLEGQTKEYGVTVIVGESVAINSEELFDFVELDFVAVKGKTEGVRIYTIAGEKHTEKGADVFKIRSLKHQRYLNFYRSQDWDLAIEVSDELQIEWPELSEFYRLMNERIEVLRIESLPRDWDGVYRATSK